MLATGVSKVNFPGTDITTSKVGFGCSVLLGAKAGRRASRRILETAYDAGIRHFDVARSYGYGEAESLLGDFLKDRRSDVTITTKFGINPPKRAKTLNYVKNFIRPFANMVPGIRHAARRHAISSMARGQFSVENARQSLDESLRELKTEAIDFFLLHECELEDLHSEELLRFLEDSKTAGKIKSFGVGASCDKIENVIHSGDNLALSFLDVIQFCNNVMDQSIARFESQRTTGCITHGAVGPAAADLQRYFEKFPQEKLRWSNRLDLSVDDSAELAKLLMSYAISRNPKGIVLFSSRNEENIKNNVALVNFQRSFSKSQLDEFEQLGRVASDRLQGATVTAQGHQHQKAASAA